MSLFSALNAAVSGLRAQSAQVSSVSENIANVSTTAYKTREVSFQSLVTGGNSSQPTGGVLFSTYQNIAEQGLIEATKTQTNVAINGSGFFVVTDELASQASGFTYSRNGSFRVNSDGALVNSEGYFLLGQATDSSGNVTAPNANDLTSLQPINTQSVSGSSSQTSSVEIDANLPADAASGDTFSTSFEIFDGLGVSHTVIQSWEKTATPNTWTMTLDDPVLTSDLSTTSGTLSATSFTIAFNGDGTLASVTPATSALSVTGFTSGSDDISFSMDLGTVNGSDGLTQYASSLSEPDITVSLIDQDGVRFGRLSEITIDANGIVSALFDNGLRQAIYQIPIATFPNPEGLTHIEGTVYDENQANAGNFVLSKPGVGNAGTITPSALELSTTDTSTEFNKMIIAQQGYSSSAQVISTADEMFDSLLRSIA